MLKRIVFYLVAFFFSFSSHAATWENLQSFQWPTCYTPQNEWRVGIGVGIEYLNLEAKVKYDLSALGAVQFGDRDHTQKKVQITPSFELGKTSFNNYYTGIIASWHHSGARKELRIPLKHTTYFTHKFKMSHYFNILAKIGYKITPKMMAYILAGPSIAKWSDTTHQFMGQVLQDTFKIKQTSVGLGLGGGIEYIFCNGLALSMNYTHHFYKAEKAQKRMSVIDEMVFGRGIDAYVVKTPRPGIVTKKITPSSDSIVMRLSYFF